MARAREEIKITESSGNVFADMGFENPEEELAKAKLVYAISKVIDAKGLTQAAVAEMIGIDQPQVSKLLRGQTAGYSSDRLIRILNELGQDVEIRVRPKPAKANRPAHVVILTPPSPAPAVAVSEKKKPYGVKPKKASRP